MADSKKIIEGWERCKKCNMSPIAPKESMEAYLNCEYTIGLYCGRDQLISETIELLKKQENQIRILRLAMQILSGKCKGITMNGGKENAD